MSYTMMCRTCGDHTFLEVAEGDRIRHVGTAATSEKQRIDGERRDADHSPDPIGVDSEEAQNEMWNRIVAHILATYPNARAVELDTSDQSDGYGFVITDVMASGDVSLLADEQIWALSDVIGGELSDLNWSERGGVLGEDDRGYAYMML